jgi:type VI secretion system protein ImpJ
VYLVLPARSSGGHKGGLARYQAEESDPVADENTGEGELRMPVLRPRIALTAGDTPPPKYVSLIIAKVRFEDESCVLTDFIPPTMAVPLHSSLGKLCADVAARLRAKAIFVSEQVRAPSAVLDMPFLLENRGRMQSLVAGLPVFEAALSTGTAHPFALYLAVCGLAGQLAALGTTLLPPVFSPYNHNDLRASFQEVTQFALRMANEGIPENYTAHPLQMKDRVFSVMFEGAWTNRRLVVGMRNSTGATEKDVISWGEECLIGSESVIGSLREKRIRGAWRQFVEKDQDLVPVRGVVLFSLRVDSEFIKPGELLQIFNLSERGRGASPLEIVLYVKRGE